VEHILPLNAKGTAWVFSSYKMWLDLHCCLLVWNLCTSMHPHHKTWICWSIYSSISLL